METRGSHVTCDAWLVETIGRGKIIAAMNHGVKIGGLHVVGDVEKDFGGGAFTAVMLLSESHMSVHYYPERAFLSIDCYTCGTEGHPLKAISAMLEAFDVTEARIRVFERGVK